MRPASGQKLQGRPFLGQLNIVRIDFKHKGLLPNVQSWHRVIDRTREWVNIWCTDQLGLALDTIDLDQLLQDTHVRNAYALAKAHHAGEKHEDALTVLGIALYLVLDDVPGTSTTPTVGKRNTDDALLLAAYGVLPSDFLTLQAFLPRVKRDWQTKEFTTEWDTRDTGHQGNWTSENVRFCCQVFLDLALKVQHAPATPRAPFVCHGFR